MRSLWQLLRLTKGRKASGAADIVFSDTAIQAFFGAATGATGAVVGDPVVGGVLGAGGPLAVQIVQAQRDRIRRVRDVVIEETGLSVEELAAWGEVTEQRRDFLMKLLEACRDAALEEKRVALGRIAARAIEDVAALDEAALFLDAIRELDGPHIRVLKAMAAPRPGGGQLAGHLVQGVIGLDELRERVPSSDHMIENVVARLRSRGAVANAAPPTFGQIEGKARWIVTRFGEELLRFLETEPNQTSS